MIISRFAPSPSGLIHIGNINSLLNLYFFLLFKKNYYFYIRIDDTNYYKYKIFYLKYLINIIFYFKIYFNNIVFQSNKFYRYIEVTQYLFNKKMVFVSYEDLNFYKFLKIYRNLNLQYSIFVKKKNKKKNSLFIIRIFFLKLNIHNKKNHFIIIKSNGFPLYNYSSVLDDVDMNINLIFRGVDHLNNLYFQILFYFILKKKLPKIFHKEILLNISGNKISKSLNNNFLKIKNFFPESIILHLFNFSHFISLKNLLFIVNFNKNVFFNKLDFLNLNFINKKIIKTSSIFLLKNIFKIYIFNKFFFKKKFYYKINLNFLLNNFFKKFFSKINDFKLIIILNKNNFINIFHIKNINKKNIKNFFYFLFKNEKFILKNKFYLFLNLYLINKKKFPYILFYLRNFDKVNILKKIKINFFIIKYIVPFV